MQYYNNVIAFGTIDVMSSSALEKNNMHLMKTLDDAWNSQDWDTFSKRHADKIVSSKKILQLKTLKTSFSP